MALYAINLPNGKTDEQGIFRPLANLYNQAGVIEATALTVSAQATPDMTVKVSGSAKDDNAFFASTTEAGYWGWNTANVNVTIGANSSGSAKTDAVVAYIDTAAGSSTANNPDGMKFTTVRGASGTATDTEINTAISSKPFIRLANVAVANGATSINSGNITDTRPFAGIGTGLVVGASLAPSAITLGYASLSTNFSMTGTTDTLVTGLSLAVTIPSGGRRVRITARANSIYNSTTNFSILAIWDGAVGSGTQLAGASSNAGANIEVPVMCMAVVTPVAGSKTYNVSLRSSGASTAAVTASAVNPACILVEAI